MEGSLKIEITREVPEGGKTAFTNNQVLRFTPTSFHIADFKIFRNKFVR